METGDGAGFRRTLHALLAKVRELGEPLPDDSLEPSELILPSPDATLEEVREMLERRRADPGMSPARVRQPASARSGRCTGAGQGRAGPSEPRRRPGVAARRRAGRRTVTDVTALGPGRARRRRG